MSGEKTYSRVVERALDKFIRHAKARPILDLRGSGLWQGICRKMREDRRPAARRRRT